MQIDRRITNGLAWAGAFLVVGVPTADLLSAQFLGDRAAPPAVQVAVATPQNVAPVPAPQSQRPQPKPVEIATAAPEPKPAAPPKAVASGSAVDNFVGSGKPLPSYITEAPAAKPVQTAAVQPAPAATPKPLQPAPVAQPQTAAIPATPAPVAPATQPAPVGPVIDPIQTAAIPPKVAPVPMPLSMRPAPVAVAAAKPVVVQPRFAVNEPVFVPPSVQPVPSAEITAEDLEDWETGPLADFLERRQGPQQAEAPTFDEEEYFTPRGQQFQRRDRLVGPEMFFFEQ